jgi:ribosome biogenesis GTPase
VNDAQTTDVHQGRVSVVFGADCLVENSQGELIRCHVPRRLTQPVCGDQVGWVTSAHQAVLTEVLPRRNELLRHDARSRQRVLAANIDRLLVVLAPEPEPDLALLDRYLVAAELLKLDTSLVFNKTDLLDADGRRHWETTLAPYQALGYGLIHSSLKFGPGVAELHALLSNRTAIVVGQSGVGKSSLVAALVPDQLLRTQQLSEASGTGQHTTTTTRLYPLPRRAGYIIDSPGVRDFRLWPVTLQDLVRGFREFLDSQGRCRFQDCRHLQEPQCDIRRRVECGEIPARRYASYRQLAEWMVVDRG